MNKKEIVEEVIGGVCFALLIFALIFGGTIIFPG